MSEVPVRRSAIRDIADICWLLVGGLLLLAIVVVVGLKTRAGQILDEDVVRSFRVDRFHAGRIEVLLSEIRVLPMALITAAAMVIALLGRHWRVAIGLPLLVVGANQTTQLLKTEYLTRSPGGLDLSVSMPSGHTTAALSMAAVLIIAVPRVLRPLACFVGGLVAGGAGIGTVAERWHRPGDVLAAVAVVVIWSVLALVVGAHWVDRPRVRAAGFDRGVGNTALAVVGAFIGAYVLHRLGMAPMPGSKANALVYGSLAVMAVVTGLGLGAISLVADRRIFRNPHTGGKQA